MPLGYTFVHSRTTIPANLPLLIILNSHSFSTKYMNREMKERKVEVARRNNK